MTGPTVVRRVQFNLEAKGRKRLRERAVEPVVVDGERIPRRTQLLAIALRFEEMLANGEVHSYAEIARVCEVSRARICQITRLLDLPHKTQEAILLMNE